MNLPMFLPTDSPGSNFVELLGRLGHKPASVNSPIDPNELRHGTTIVAMRYRDGVVMAGDRRATVGHTIANRDMQKVFMADRHSGVAISGVAGTAWEMVRLFQTNLEHYEKVEGEPLSLEGKANQLSGMIRSNLGMAMQGMVVIPIFAGYDLKRDLGRIFSYDITGGRYEEKDFCATGSGGRDARTTIKLGWKQDLTRESVIELAISALYEAADEDAATGGPDVVRGIYPIVAVITENGFEDVPDEEVAERFNALIQTKTAHGHQP